jgi:hypothetical protein
MRRFILCSLSATMAMAVGSAAHAQDVNDTIARLEDFNVFCAEEGPFNRAEERQFEYRSQDLVGGILSPDEGGPNNRAIPTTGFGEYYEETYFGNNQVDCYEPSPTDFSLYDPSSSNQLGQSNYNQMQRNNYNQMQQDNYNQMQQDNQMDENEYPTEGTILSPDPQGPNNRAVPGSGQVEEEY